MLCPKCGFISFDHLSVCGKCHHDLSGVGTALHGTAASTTCQLFLGSVLKEAEPAAKSEPEIAATASFTTEEYAKAGPEPATYFPDMEEATEGTAADQSSGLEFDLDEISLSDSSDLTSVTAVEKSAEKETPPPSAETITLLAREDIKEGGQPMASPPPEIAAAQTLEIDVSSLTLDTFEETPTGEKEPESSLTIDFNEIDLSDLVHTPGKKTSDQAESGARPQDGGPDLEDTMDLSLFGGESNEPPSDELLYDKGDTLDPIDLTLVDEALVELTMDPGHKEEPPQVKKQPEEPELHMEESDK